MKSDTDQQPTYLVDGVVHYCVTNMPGAVGRTSTVAQWNATLPYALKIANKGYECSAKEDSGFAEGINMVAGEITNSAVAEANRRIKAPRTARFGLPIFWP